VALRSRVSARLSDLVLFAVHEFGDDFPLVAGRIVSVGVLFCFALRPLLPGASAVHGLVLVKVVMLVLVKVALGHVCCFSSHGGSFV